MKSGIWGKVPKLHMYFLPQGVNSKLIFTLRAAIFEIRANFQNFYIWAWNLEFDDRSQSCISTLFLPQRVKIKIIFGLRTSVFEIWTNFQNFHIWVWNLEFEERSLSCICNLFVTHGVEIQLIFALRAGVLEIDLFSALTSLINKVN